MIQIRNDFRRLFSKVGSWSRIFEGPDPVFSRRLNTDLGKIHPDPHPYRKLSVVNQFSYEMNNIIEGLNDTKIETNCAWSVFTMVYQAKVLLGRVSELHPSPPSPYHKNRIYNITSPRPDPLTQLWISILA